MGTQELSLVFLKAEATAIGKRFGFILWKG